MPIASVKPFRNTAPSSASRTSVIDHLWPCSKPATYGFSTTWAVASAADSVIVIRKSVAAKPEQHQHEELALPERQQPLQHRDRALAVRALLRHPAVDRQRAEQRHRDQHQGRHRREQRRPRARRCPAGSPGWRSSRRRSGTSPSTTGASGAGWVRRADQVAAPAGGRRRRAASPASLAGQAVHRPGTADPVLATTSRLPGRDPSTHLPVITMAVRGRSGRRSHTTLTLQRRFLTHL